MFITEALAAGQYLSDYPENVSYAELCELILQQSDDVTVWEPFEDYPPEWVVEHMNNLQETLEDAFNNHTQVEDSTGDR